MNDLRRELEALRNEVDTELRQVWNRSLPFADSLFDRWERARQLGFAEDANIYDSAHVFGNVSIGSRTWVGPYVILDGSGADLTIGAGCDISAGVHIYTHDTALRCVSMGEAPVGGTPVRIGDWTYVGSQSVIVAGVEIGSQCIVGANSFVNLNIPDRTVVAGNPAQAIGQIMGEGKDTHIVHFSQKSTVLDPSESCPADGGQDP